MHRMGLNKLQSRYEAVDKMKASGENDSQRNPAVSATCILRHKKEYKAITQ